ncbi:hypothetical protein [Rossellomorea sp. NRS-1567]|uniref:hypothetical protein n=1 Tax=Rossellomorea sp. NRS-1567 TaxID=3233901 RepID=UPI003D26E332
MSKATVIKACEGIFEKAEQIKESYALALDRAKEEQAELVKAIAEGEMHLEEVYRNYVLGIVSLDAYQQEQKLLQDKKSVLNVTGEKIKDVDKLMKEELAGLVKKFKELGPDYAKVNNKNKAEGFADIQEAKKNYLQALHEAQLKIKETAQYSVMIGHLQVDAGLKDFNYTSREGENTQILSRAYDSYKGADVSAEEVRNAYWNGK